MAKNPNEPSNSKGKQLAAIQDEGNDNSSAVTSQVHPHSDAEMEIQKTSAGNLDRVGLNARAQESVEEERTRSELWYPLWSDAIQQKKSSELLRLLTENADEFPWQYEKKDQTALHVAAMQGDRDLAKSILDQLWKARQERYKDDFREISQYCDRFYTLCGYIRAVDSSGKTALELATENVAHENSKAICDYIEVILRRSEAHNVIDKAVHTLEFYFDSLEDNTTERLDLERIWIAGIHNRECTILLKALEYHRTASISSQHWMCKHSGRSGLHVAAMQGCFPLAKEILDKAKEENNRDYIEAVDPESGLTALQMADDIIGNRSIAEYIKFTLQLLENKGYVHPCLFEAYPRSPWCIALSTGHSGWLLKLLSINSRFVLETYKGLTVLHWAIIWNDEALVAFVLFDLLRDGKKIEWEERSNFPAKLTWKHMFEKGIPAGDYNLRQMNRPNPAFEALVKDRPFTGSVIQLAGLVKSNYGDDSDIEKRLIEYQERDKVESPDRFRNFYLPGDRRDISLVIGAINKNWNSKWNRGFLADVDFNFEAPLFDRRSLELIEGFKFESHTRLSFLRLHYALKHPLVFEDFLKSLSFDFPITSWMHDAQGRSLFQIVDHQEIFARQVVEHVLQELFAEEDAKGRTLSDIVLMKNYLGHNTLLLDFGRPDDYEYDPTRGDDYDIAFMFYQVATILKQTTVAQQIWSEILERDSDKLKVNLRKFEPLPFVAASTGNQTILQLLLEGKVDLTITDKDGRTLLHHAANATLLDFATLLECPMIGHCFSTVQDMCKVRRKWNLDRKKTAVIFPSRESQTQGDVEKLETQVNVGRKACILMLLQAGVDLSQEDREKKIPNIGPTNDAMYQGWWYDMVVKDSTDKKNSFNQAGNALSVVGALVAGTSYIGPLQPPMNYTQPDGFVHIGEKLVEVFMVTNTLAFYLALASVMFAVVPSLPMPRESVLSELKRAQHTVSLSLCLLLTSIVFIIISFTAASMVVIQDQHSFSKSGLLTFPSIIGLFFCVIAIISYLKRLMRLMFYNNAIIRSFYQFSIIKFCKHVMQTLRKLCKRVCKRYQG